MSDEYLYLQAQDELDKGEYSGALWAKALTNCGGDDKKAYYRYVDLRVEQLKRYDRSESTQTDDLHYYNGSEHSRSVSITGDRGSREGNERQNSDASFKTSFVRKIVAGISFLCGLGFAVLGLCMPFIMEGDTIGAALVVTAIFLLISWQLIRGGYGEIEETSYAGWGCILPGGILSLGMLVNFHKWLTSIGASYGDIFSLPSYPDLFLPGLINLTIGALLVYFGWTGLQLRTELFERNQVRKKQGREPGKE